MTLDGGAPIMVDLYTPGDAYKKTIYTTGFLPDVPHTLVIEWTGTKNGAASYYQIGVDAFDIIGTVTLAPPPPPIPTRYQESHSYITYLGSWGSTTASLASGGSYWYSDSTAAQAIVTFNGTELAWIGTTSKYYGKARVTVDAGPTQYVDFYSPGTVYQTEVFNTGPLPPGDHTLLIQPDGTKHAAALGYWISLDAFDVFDELTDAPNATRVEQGDSALTYVGSWSNLVTPSASGGNLYSLNSAGSVTVEFDGTHISWVSRRASDHGTAWLRLDGGLPIAVDLYSASTQAQRIVWSSGVLAPGVHTLCVSWAGAKAYAASSSKVSVDAFDIMGTVNAAPAPPEMPQRYQNSNSLIQYLNTWSTRWAATASGGSFYYRNAAGSATIRFDGTYFSWVARKGPSYGKATVTVDGGPATTIDLYKWITADQMPVFSTVLLPPGVHTVVITWLGTKNASSTSYVIDVDAVDVIGTLVP